jgi:hypothetical protein
VTHPGFDICSRCLHDVVRARQREERAEVKRRRAEREHRLSRANRALINEVDLKEPQLREREETTTWLVEPPEQLPAPASLGQAIAHITVDRKLENLPDGLPRVEALVNSLIQDELKHTPVDLRPRVPERYRRHITPPPEEEPVPPVAETPPVQEPAKHVGRPRTPRSPEVEAEIIEMFKSGISTTEIQTAYGIGPQTLYTIVRRYGVPLRGASHGGRPRKESSMPEPVKTSPPVSASVAPTPTPNGAVSDLTEWVVTYEVVKTETVVVAAKSFNDAAAAVGTGGINVVSVARKR